MLVVLALGTAAGVMLLSRVMPGRSGSVDGEHLLRTVMAHVERGYIVPSTEPELYGLAVEGMLRRLGDPHAAYIPADRVAGMRERFSGTTAGPGIDIDERDRWIVVVSAFTETPAKRAGIRSGDRIVRINGKSTNGMTAEEARLAIQGPPGSQVALVIERIGGRAPLSFMLSREPPAGPAVRTAFMLTQDVGYLRLDRFSGATSTALINMIDSLRGLRMTSLILDVRGNPGGFPEDGIPAADVFVPEGKVLGFSRGRTQKSTQNYTDQGPSRYDGLELIVLVDEGTANASEVMAGALQDVDRALILGRPTFGKGSRQEMIGLADGAAVVLTTSRWYTPSGRSIDATPVVRGSSRPIPRDSSVSRPAFRTESGRTVLGGGGILPDVLVGPTGGRVGIESSLDAALYTAGNAQEIVERDAFVRAAVTLAGQADGQLDLINRAIVTDRAEASDSIREQ